MTSAIDELCARLTDRGVEYTIAGRGYVMWQANKGEFMAFEHDGALSVCLLGSIRLTPTQAIAATLSSCNCSNNCTNSERTGTCHDVCNGLDTLIDSEVGASWYADRPRRYVWFLIGARHERLASRTHSVQAMEQRATRAQRVPKMRAREVRKARAAARVPEKGMVGVSAIDKQGLERAVSTLSAQIDELREMAGGGSMEWVASPVRASVLRDAADTIDKLRELVGQMYHTMHGVLDNSTDTVWVGTVGTLRDEMDWYMQDMAELGMPPADYERRMRELGVEVE